MPWCCVTQAGQFLVGCASSIPCHEPGTAPVGLTLSGPRNSNRARPRRPGVYAVNYDPHTATFLSFSRARDSFASGADTPRAFLERCLERIDELEPTIRAFVRLDIAGARSAADASTRRWQRNAPRSAVDGLPVGIKDCFDVRGFPTELNSALFAGNTASLDAAHVDALRRGGALIVGKTTTTELTMALPAPTLNPWNHSHTPGGSSSGSAAAVAACMLPLATGSQVRGSIIRPASICGVVGMKPTFGALNRYGGIEITPSLNHLGFLGGTLSDIWEAAQHIASVVGEIGHSPQRACVPHRRNVHQTRFATIDLQLFRDRRGESTPA